MGLITAQDITYYELVMLEEIQELLVGPFMVAKAPNLPPGTQIVPRDKLKALKGRAKLGKKGQPIPREIGDIERGAVQIPEISHGFSLHRKDLQAKATLPDIGARQSTRLVLERLENLIFNGEPTLGIDGIYADAGLDPYVIDDGYEWNTSNGQPFNDMVDMFGTLNATNKFRGKKLALAPRAYWAAQKTNINGISYFDQIAKLFPNGANDIYIAPLTADQDRTIIPADGGLLCDYGPRIAERLVEEEINLQQDFEMDENNLFPFNVVTYQSLDIQELDAFLPLENLVDLTIGEEEP